MRKIQFVDCTDKYIIRLYTRFYSMEVVRDLFINPLTLRDTRDVVGLIVSAQIRKGKFELQLDKLEISYLQNPYYSNTALVSEWNSNLRSQRPDGIGNVTKGNVGILCFKDVVFGLETVVNWKVRSIMARGGKTVRVFSWTQTESGIYKRLVADQGAPPEMRRENKRRKASGGEPASQSYLNLFTMTARCRKSFCGCRRRRPREIRKLTRFFKRQFRCYGARDRHF